MIGKEKEKGFGRETKKCWVEGWLKEYSLQIGIKFLPAGIYQIYIAFKSSLETYNIF